MALVQKSFSDLITFTRSTGGGRFNAQGQYEWLPANTPRIDYDPATGECLGLLIEEQRTNLLTYSSDFANAAWTKVGVSVAGGIASPDGGSGASRAKTTSVNATSPARAVSDLTAAGGTYTYSVWLRADTPLSLSLQVPTPSYGTYLATKTVSVTQIWQRFDITFTGQAAALWIRVSDTGTEYDIWGAQLEAGSFPTSYIPTTTAQVTRAADIASVNELSPWFNASEGAFVIESTNRQKSTGGTFGLSIGSSSTSYIGAPYHTTTGVSASLFGTAGGVSKNLSIPHKPDKVAFSYGSDGIIALVAGGVSYGSLTYPALPSFSNLLIGRGHFGGSAANAHYKSIRYFPRRLSDAELQAMTA